MKHGVNFPGFWESEFICDRRKDLRDGERSFLLWGKFWINNLPFQIMSFYPHFVSFLEWSEMSLRSCCHGLSSSFIRVLRVLLLKQQGVFLVQVLLQE